MCFGINLRTTDTLQALAKAQEQIMTNLQLKCTDRNMKSTRRGEIYVAYTWMKGERGERLAKTSSLE